MIVHFENLLKSLVSDVGDLGLCGKSSILLTVLVAYCSAEESTDTCFSKND